MSDDIVERLRQQATIGAKKFRDFADIPLEWKAADEIERLRARVEELTDALIDARHNGLIYWSPMTERGAVEQAKMMARIDKVLNKEAQAMSERWQSIETAPRDGRAVILCWAINADGGPIDWTENMQTAGVFVQVASWREAIGEWAVYADRISDPILHFNPTHWMPLPLPPCKEAKP